jgi:diguanylate cyclase (GGDEF)-like protein
LVGPLRYEANQNLLTIINVNIFLFSLLLILNIFSISDVLLNESYQMALTAAKLETFTDPLTKISNRRYLEKITPELEREAAAGRRISAALLDIDKFKDINDKCGHAFGDYVLIRVVTLIKEIFRSEDAFIRYGGEEFLIIMKDVTEENAFNAIERLRRAMRSQIIEKDGNCASVTFTCGVAEFKKSLEETVELADKRMYVGKNTGRDKTVGSQNAQEAL